VNDYRARRPWRHAEPETQRRYALGPMPPDRKGLIAVFHPLCVRTKEQILVLNDLAKACAADTGQRVYTVMTQDRWYLLLFGIPVTNQDSGQGGVWYDDRPGGVVADDRYIAHFDPDGSWTLDGAS
jgi:hypothetical protein